MDINLEHRLTETEERSKSNTKRLDAMEKRQDDLDDLVTTVKILADREERVETDVKEIKTDVKGLTEKPGKRWDGLVEKALTILIGAVLGLALSQIGL